jgi:hypothetical protein
MPATIRRHTVVLLLIAVAAAGSAALGGREQPNPALPAVATMADPGAWRVETAYAQGDAGGPFRQWLLRDRAGSEALLYVGATSHVQVLVKWTGELGYQGEGYLVTSRSERTLPLPGGATATVTRTLVWRLGDQRLLEYAVVRPDGVVPSGASAPVPLALGVLSGRAGPYYPVRVAVPAGQGEVADRLLAAALPPLAARARAGAG